MTRSPFKDDIHSQPSSFLIHKVMEKEELADRGRKYRVKKNYQSWSPNYSTLSFINHKHAGNGVISFLFLLVII